MSDAALLDEILAQIEEGIQRIERRFEGIEAPEDFVRNDAGIDRLDGIAMMLIAIGEALKNFERQGGQELLARHSEVDWKGAKGVRDFLSHHYFDIDPEAVYLICAEKLTNLKSAVSEIRTEIRGSQGH